MRSTENEPPRGRAQRFGALITELAKKSGYDLTAGGGGRALLARETGMSPSATSRMIDGKTLPMPQQLEGIARAVGVDVRTLLISAGVISERAWPEGHIPDVLSATTRSLSLSPEEAVDMWGITDPVIRSMLLGSIEQAIRLQREADAGPGATPRGEAIGRG